MRKWSKKRLTVLFATLIALSAVAIGAMVLIPEYQYRFSSAVLKDGNLKIYPGETLSDIAQKLRDDGIIEKSEMMVKFAHQHSRDSLMVGNYKIDKGSSYRSLLNRLALGRQTPIRLTFNSFRTVDRLIGAVARRTLVDSASFMKVMNNQQLLDTNGFTRQNLISMFIPNTYEVYWTITPLEFFNKMKSEYTDFWNSYRTQKAINLGFSRAEIATIASIVDAETNKQDEMTNIAGTYINRLRKGIPLQADPTVKFALQNFGIKRILHRHLKIDSPYNTYKNSGLPPGPIGMPSIAAIDATLTYTKHNYLYFCAKADFSGYHAFASNLSDHNRNARAYQKELNRRKIK